MLVNKENYNMLILDELQKLENLSSEYEPILMLISKRIDRSIIEKAIAKIYLKMICNTIYKKVDEDDNAGKGKAYKSFHILAGYLESKGITGIIYPCTRTKKIIGKNLVFFNRYDAVPIKDSIREIIYK